MESPLEQVETTSVEPGSNLENTTDKLPVKNKGGRPKGSKNKDTIFKEMMSTKFQNVAKSDIQKVYKILFERAQEGDMKAIKLILDRVVPVTKAVDLAELEKGGLQINIQVGDMKNPYAEADAIDADYVEVVED